jgi:hypothetical protein
MNSPNPSAPQDDFDIGALYAGQFVKAIDLGGKSYAATIVAVEPVEIANQDGGVRRLAKVTLQGWPAALLLNKTNFEAIADAYGRLRAGWIGKPLEVYPDTTLFGGRTVPCIRVRVPRPAAPAAAVPGGVPIAPAGPAPATPSSAPVAAPPAQAAILPPLMAAADLADDIPY